MSKPGRVLADPARERLNTPANLVTLVRTVASVSLAATAAVQQDLTLLVVALVVHWVGDSLDGLVARLLDCETRTGAVADILCDRLCVAAFYVGLAWLQPHLAPAIFVYLAMFMVVDCFLSLSFLAWPITSPNYFYVVDRGLWLRNWSHPAKAVNSGLFAILLLVTGSLWLGLLAAGALLAAKCWSVVSLLRIGLPIPTGPREDVEGSPPAQSLTHP